MDLGGVMSFLRIFPVCILLALAACSDVDPSNPYDPGAPETVQARAVVTGTVEVEEGGPAVGATVTLQGTGITGKTNDDGTFRLPDISHGSYVLTIALARHGTLAVPVLELTRGETRTLDRVILAQARGAIRGRLEVAGQLPLEMERVRLRVGAAGGQVDLVPDADEPGQAADFTISGVLSGPQTLVASAGGYRSAPVEGIEVPEGGTIELPEPVRLEPVPVEVSGRVDVPAGWEGAVADIEVVATQGGLAQTVDVGADGAFAFTAERAGDLRLTVAHPGFRRFERSVSVIAEARPATLEPITLEYAFGGLRGRVRTADCAPVGVPVLVAVLDGPTERSVVASVPGADTEGCAEGAAFELSDLRAGTYRLRFASADYVTQDAPDAVTVVEETTAEHPEVTLAVASGQLRGHVDVPSDGADGFSLAGTRVSLEGTDLAGETNDSGDFEIGDVRPGVYSVRIRREGGTWQDFRAPSVAISPLQTVDLGDIGLDFARGNIAGRAELSTGESAAGIEIRLTGPEFATVRTDAEGNYLLAGYRVGTYRLTASQFGFDSPGADVTIERHLQTVDAPLLTLPLLPGAVTGSVDFDAVAGEGPPTVSAGERSTPVGVDGRFRLEGLRAGTYTVTVSHPPRYRERALPGVIVEPGNDTALEGITLERASGRVRARYSLADAVRLGPDAAATLLGSIQVSLSSERGGLSYSSLADRAGNVEFPSVLVDRYTLSAALPNYLPNVIPGVEIAADRDERSFLDQELTLPINPGRIVGDVRFSDRAGDADGIEVAVLGTEVQLTTGEDGHFELTNLKAGVYAIQFTGPGDGYRPVTVSPVIVVAGEETPMSEVVLPPAYGAIAGTVSLEGRDDATGAVVQVLSGGEVVDNTVVNADGTFSVPAVRVGTYTVVAHHELYSDETANAVDVELDETTALRFDLDLRRGSIDGVVVASDGAAAGDLDITVELEQSGDVVLANGAGAFTFNDLAPGVYTLRATADGFDDAVSQPVTVGPGQTVELDGDHALVLTDRRAPIAPGLTVCDAAEPLPGFPEVPAFVAVEATRAPFVLHLQLDAASDPRTDLNFDPSADLGHWEIRVGDSAWRVVDPADFSDAEPGCPEAFAVPLVHPNTLQTIELRAVDAEGNAGDSGLAVVVADPSPPKWFALQPPDDGGLRNDPEQEDVTIRRGDADVQVDPVTAYYTSAAAVDVSIKPPGLDPGFGCYYVHTAAWSEVTDPRNGFASAGDYVVGRLLDDDNRPRLEALQTEECLPAGTQKVSLEPEAERTMFCVMGLDQAGRFASFAPTALCREDADCDDPGSFCDPQSGACQYALGAPLPAPRVVSNCVVVISDATPPEAPDVWPDGAEVRGGRALLFTSANTAALDPNFEAFELQGPGPDPRFRRIEMVEVGGVLGFEVSLIPGESNTLTLRAVDKAGNEGAPTTVTIEDTTLAPVAEGEAAVGASPSIVGERIVWAQPAGCDPDGVSNLCAWAVRLQDDSGLLPDAATLTPLRTCAYGCPAQRAGEDDDGAAREPLVSLLPNGLVFADYTGNAGGSEHRLYYQHFGTDGEPGTADDGRRPSCAVNAECSAILTGSTCSSGRCTAPAGYVADDGALPINRLAGSTANGAILELVANENQVAYATVNTSAQTWTYTVHRFFVHPTLGWALGEQSLSAVPGSATITSRVVGLATFGDGTASPVTGGTAFVLADGTAWFWANGAAAATAITLPTIAANTTSKAIGVAGSSRYVVLNLQAYSGNTPADAPTVALVADLGGNARPDAGETLVGLPGGCGAGCPDQTACIRLQLGAAAASNTCAARIGHEDLRCEGGRHPQFCGRIVVQEHMDGDLLAWTNETLDDDGQPRASLVTLRVAGGATAPPRVVVDRVGRKTEPAVHLDRVAYVDAHEGSPRVTVAEPAPLSWLELDQRPKAHPLVGQDWAVYASYEPGTPAVLVAAAAPSLPIDGTLRLTIAADGPTLTREVTVEDLADVEALVRRLNEDPTLRLNGRPVLQASILAGNTPEETRIVLTTFAVGSGASITVNQAAFGFGANQTASGSDGYSDDSGLKLLLLGGLSPAIPVPTGQRTDRANAQLEWSTGQNYALAGNLLVAIELAVTVNGANRNETRREIVAYRLPDKQQRQTLAEQGTPCVDQACLTARRTVVATYTAAGNTSRAIATDGRYVVWSVTGAGAEAGVFLWDSTAQAAPQTLSNATVKCRKLAIGTYTPDGAPGPVTQIACAGWLSSAVDPNDQVVRFYRRAGANGAFVTDATDVPDGTGGLISGVWMHEADLVVTRQEDGIERINVRHAGPDGVFGPNNQDQSDDVPDTDGADGRFGTADDDVPFTLVRGRNGEDLGSCGLYRGQFVFADTNAVGQAEIYRMRLRGRQIDRLTHDGATQHHVAIGETGLLFVDHRYTVTAQGLPMKPPGLTLRLHP